MGSLVGLWELVPLGRTSPRAHLGLQLSLEIDSATGDRFSGYVVRWFAGDVAVRPSNFGRVTGRTNGAAVQLMIPFARSHAAPIVITARRVADDTLRIVAAARGLEPGPFDAGALLVRRRRGRATAPP